MADKETFYIIGCMGPKKMRIYLDHNATLQDLSQKVEQLFLVNQGNQKLIYKGKLLSSKNGSLQSFGIRKGDSIMVLGKVTQSERDTLLKQLEKFEESFYEEERSVGSIITDDKPQSDVQCKETMKKLLFANENLMKLLESLDGMEIKVPCEEVRSKRKSLVKNIQSLMDKIDQDYNHLQSKTS